MTRESPLLTDLYQLTMLQGYYNYNMDEIAVFEFFVRKLPKGRNFLVAAGLEQVVAFLKQVAFQDEDIDFLKKDGRFQPGFLDSLKNFHFSGDVDGVREGTIFFPNEPILRISAPIAQAQLIETRIINILQFQTIIASKAARLTQVASQKILVDFGLRRAHGKEAGLLAARASYLAGFSGTSTVLAGKMFNIPIFGTMAHSFIQAHDSETAAFAHFAETQPDNAVLLIDTYDTERGAQKVVQLAPKLLQKGIRIKGVRLDSGDMIVHSKNVRQILDRGGLQDVQIFTSGNLDEYKLAEFAAAKAPIDGFGVGTRLITSADAPYLDCAYKLVEYAGLPRRKRSEGKATWPGRKQVFRSYDENENMKDDILTIKRDSLSAKPLIQPVIRHGELVASLPSLEDVRRYALSELASLPSYLKTNEESKAYPVHVSGPLKVLADEVDRRMDASN